jgi:hypothetical protein
VLVALGGLAVFRILFSLAVLVASPGRLFDGLPRYRYDPLTGDAYGYYSCVREILAVWRRDAKTMLPLTLLAVLAVVIVWRRSRSGVTRLAAIVAAAAAISAGLAAYVRFTGAAQFGWPLLLSVPALPFRIAGVTGPGVVFAIGLALALAANAVTVVATWSIARSAGLSDRLALAPAAAMAFWPLLSLLTGSQAARNATWQIDLGLSMYTEPVSTALVVASLALLLARVNAAWTLAAGAMLGFATLIRNSNVLVVLCVIGALFLLRERTRASLVAGGALAWAPATLLFWPKGYPKLHPPVFPAHPFEWRYAKVAWEHSYLWHPSVLVVLVPLALLGCFGVRSRAGLLMWPSVAATALFYTFYELTPIHPRFLFVVLPLVLVLWVAGARRLATTIARV